MKRLFSRGNLIVILVLAYVLLNRLPSIISNFKAEGIILETKNYQLIAPTGVPSEITFPPKERKVLAIFWATWCGPCKLEMNRLKTSIENKDIPENGIVAINPFEPPATVEHFLKENKYPFLFIDAPEVSKVLNISATPTTVFIENGTLNSISSGLSILGIWRAEAFLD